MRIIELHTDSEFAAIFPLVKQQNPALSKREFTRRLGEMRAQDYRCIAAVEKGEYVGICGIWQGTRFWCGRFIDVDNVVVEEKRRGLGIGRKMLEWVEKESKKQGCAQVGLDAYTTSHAAHRFYFREGYIIKGYHFIKPLM